MRTIQAMVLVTYFLMNDNHASDAWAFAGILIRQAYAMGLNRDPSIITPTLSAFDKQQRRKLWQAVLLQDTFFAVILSLPPTATHTDVKVEDLTDHEIEDAANGTSINEATDICFIRSMWTLANLVQETLCSPRSLSLPIAASPSDRVRVINRFQRIYTSFPHPFRTFTEASICELASRNKRLARQTLFLTSNYFHCLMLVCADENEDLGVDVNGTLDAAHEAINSFFMLHALFEDEARVWYHFQHRAFSEAVRKTISFLPSTCLAGMPLTRGGHGPACHCGVGQKPSGRLGHGSHVYTGENGRCSDDWDSATEERYGYRGQNPGLGFEQLCASFGVIDYRWATAIDLVAWMEDLGVRQLFVS